MSVRLPAWLASPLLGGGREDDEHDEAPLLWGREPAERRPHKRRRLAVVAAAGAALFAVAGTTLLATGGHEHIAKAAAHASATVQDAAVQVSSSIGHVAAAAASLAAAAASTLLHSGSLPDENAPRIDTQGTSTLAELDLQVCGTTPCRFMVAGNVREQNSKAQIHITQIGELSKRLNRVLVLPRVEGGQYSTCYRHPFDLYHDIEAVSEKLGMHVMQYDDFLSYIARRQELTGRSPTGQLVYVTGHSKERFSIQLEPKMPGRSPCIADLDLSPFKNVSLASHDLKSQHELRAFGEFMVETLDSADYIQQVTTITDSKLLPDVYHVVWWPNKAVFLKPGEPQPSGNLLPFHPRWEDLADELARDISPAVALHWRQESVDAPTRVPDFLACAQAAQAMLDAFGSTLKTIYFMTDFPVNGVVHSVSYYHFLQSDQEYRQAAEAGIEALYASAKAAGQKMVTLDELRLQIPMANGTLASVRDLDAGLLGILDKSIAERTEQYLVGKPNVCGRYSSFSSMVVAERRDHQGHDGSLVQKDVDYFPAAGSKVYE